MGSGWEPSPGAKQPEHEADFSHHLMFKFHEVFLNPAPPPDVVMGLGLIIGSSLPLLTPCSRVLVQKPKVTQLVKQFPPLVPSLKQIHPAHNFPPCFCKIRSNIIFPSTPRFSKFSPLFRFPDQNRVYIYVSCVLHVPPISSSMT
jgi:hypothetical protein